MNTDVPSWVHLISCHPIVDRLQESVHLGVVRSASNFIWSLNYQTLFDGSHLFTIFKPKNLAQTPLRRQLFQKTSITNYHDRASFSYQLTYKCIITNISLITWACSNSNVILKHDPASKSISDTIVTTNSSLITWVF